jgi:co-chaperonin GroES (HSP10)
MFQPMNDNVLLREVKEEVSAGGIYVPIQNRSGVIQATVIAVSPGQEVDGKHVSYDALEGATVLVPVDLVLDIKIKGESYLVAKATDLLGVLEGGQHAEEDR